MLRQILARIARYLPIYRELLQIRDGVYSVNRLIDTLRAMEAARYHERQIENHPRYQEPRRLQRHAAQVNSQNGEDGMIREIFRRIGTSNRVFAEVGVGDGTENNSAFLLAQGWKGFWIDGDDAFTHTLGDRGDLRDGCLTTRVAFVDRENIGALFEQLGVPLEFDLLSLDIDQNTYYIWEALGAYSPRVVVVEYNPVIPPDFDWKVPYRAGRKWDGTHNYGASLKAFELLGRHLGYSLVGCDFYGVNAFFVRDDLVMDRFAEPFTAENHYEPPRYPFIHQRGHARAILHRQEAG